MSIKILPVIHYESAQSAYVQATVAHTCGADGVFLISHNNQNDALPSMCGSIKALLPGLKVGVNFLGYGVMDAYRAAALADFDMLWLDAPGFASTGLTTECVELIDHLQNDALDTIEVFASVAFKYQPVEPFPVKAASIARLHGFIPTTSGAATGEAPDLEKIKGMFDRRGPLAVASGMTPDNIATFAPFLSHVLVATGISHDGNTFDADLLRRFIARARDVSLY